METAARIDGVGVLRLLGWEGEDGGEKEEESRDLFCLNGVNWSFLLCLYIAGRVLCGMEEVYVFIYLPSWLSVESMDLL